MRLGLGFARQQRDVVPGWVDPGALLAMQFGPDRYWRKQGGLLPATSVLTTTRSSSIVLPDSAGVFQTLGNNTLPRTDRGLYANGQFTNLVARLNPTVAQCPTRSNVTDAAGFAGFGNSIRFPGGVTAYAYQSPTIASGTSFAASFLIQMEDGNPPTFGSASVGGSANTFAIVVNSVAISPLTYTTQELSAGVYRVSVAGTTTSGSNFGIIQYAGNQDRVFKVCGYQLFTGSLAPDALVPGSSDTGGPTLLASDIRAVQGVRPSNSQPEPFPGWEAAGLDDGFTVLADFENRARGASFRRLFQLTGGTGVVVGTQSNGTSLRLEIGGVSTGTTAPGGQTGERSRVAVRVFADGNVAIGQKGSEALAAAVRDPLTMTHSTFQVGNTTSLTSPWNDWIYGLQICKPLSDAALLDWVNA